jgi:cytochrome c
MFSSPSLLRASALLTGLVLAGAASAQQVDYAGIGRPATAQELKAWDIDVRPDFKGLPPGSGSVEKGLAVWEAKCASCHGVFGESNQVFSPIIGGTSKDDITSGRVARLSDPSFPQRTTLMKAATLSTLWDYINRAMPWTQPKSLTVEDVYAVTAYMLNLAEVVPDNFVLSDKNIAEVQQRLPNRNGMTTEHGLWPGRGFGNAKPDVAATACMKNCAPEPQVASFIPDYAKNAHGNLADQNRLVGPQRGVNTAGTAAVAAAAGERSDAPPSTTAVPAAAASKAPVATRASAAAATDLTQKYTCVTCHGMENSSVGPSFRDIARKYAGRSDASAYLAGKIKAGGSGVWGGIPMPAQALSESEATLIAEWLVDGAKK